MKQFFKFSSPTSVVLADNETLVVDSSQIYDVVLSPKYYWAKKENLPVKYTYQAKSYANSSFEGIVPKGEYKYLAKKTDDGFWLYAYDEQFILGELEKIGLNPSQIGKVYFAQVEFENITTPIRLNSKEVLTNHGGNIIKVPAQMVDKSLSFESHMETHSLSKFSVSLNQFAHLIDFNKMIYVAVTLFVLILLYATHYSWLGNEQQQLVEKKQKIAKKYKMPQTKMQTDALIRQLNKKANAQINLREKFYALTKMPLTQKEYFSNIAYENKNFEFSLVLSSAQRVPSIQNYLKKHFTIDSMQPQGNRVTFKVHL